MKTIKHNIQRIEFLLALYQMSEEEFLTRISEGLKNPITKKDIWNDEIKISHLKRIDKLFEKGIGYYLDPSKPSKSKETSIFFRKTELGEELDFADKKIVNQFEEDKFYLFATAKLSDFNFDRKLKVFTVNQDPKEVGFLIREQLNPKFKSKSRDYLEELIRVMAEQNIFVFEFIEHWNKKEKSNIDGFFLQPNVIVVKRQQKYLKREIFTLVHELGHYLLNKEIAEKVDFYASADNAEISKIERWCNDFAYYFLSGDFDKELQNAVYEELEKGINSELVAKVSTKTHLSKTAIYTKLRMMNKISSKAYFEIKRHIENALKQKEEKEKAERERLKELGVKQIFGKAKPIKSPLVISAYQKAYFEGVISEYEFCQRLNIKADKFEKYAYESSY